MMDPHRLRSLRFGQDPTGGDGNNGDDGNGDGSNGGGEEDGGSGGDDPNSPNYVSGFTYQGCYQATQDDGLRLLRGPNEQRVGDLTRESCESFCAGSTGAPFKYFGIEAGRDCRCSNTLSWDNPEDDASLCTTQLTGDPNHTAGGSNRISVWQNDAYNGEYQDFQDFQDYQEPMEEELEGQVEQVEQVDRAEDQAAQEDRVAQEEPAELEMG
ncbi:uncharacterized protein N0V89_002067 [Didymosphaeria variabile]|uniref:WSC domain-containing protein n=1 Tax=Didymosphaeria variabile TaxID=1932322 RepID=A0A9W8XRU9_9PLEO|nr:uncharacterized protein N0V89_002067 [Didymosphaeria variabile]KAJ4357491.1 hypothetical protein N0V89_002067 [Didymosphaeria variabile]